jgi:hypothetical protein
MLRLNLLIPNTGPGGGNNPVAAFPNGRRRATQGDNVNANDAPFRNTFPFFAPPAPPFPAGTIDYRTHN